MVEVCSLMIYVINKHELAQYCQKSHSKMVFLTVEALIKELSNRDTRSDEAAKYLRSLIISNIELTNSQFVEIEDMMCIFENSVEYLRLMASILFKLPKTLAEET